MSDWRKSAQNILDSRGYVNPKYQSYEVKLNNGQVLGTVSYGAMKAIENNTLDRYKPRDAEEEKVIYNYIEYAKTLEKETKKEQKDTEAEAFNNQEGVKQLAEKYGIEDLYNFSYDDMIEWAGKHPNINFDVGSMDRAPSVSSKRDGIFGVFGKKLASDEEMADAEALLTIAKNNANRKLAEGDHGAFVAGAMSAAETVGDVISLGVVDKAVEWKDSKDKSKLQSVGIDEKYHTSQSEVWDKTQGEHPVASTVGTLTGLGITLVSPVGKSATGKAVSTAKGWGSTYKNILTASKALGATKGTIRTAKLARTLPTIMTMATSAFLTYNRQQSKSDDSKTDDNKKDTPLAWLEKQIAAGNAQYAKGIASSLDFILPTEVMGKYDFISKVNDYYGNASSDISSEAQQSGVELGKGWEIAGEAVQVVTAALPNSITALFLAGANVPGQATQITKNKTINAIANYLKQTAKNPQYWTSMLQTIGTDYEEAKENGASDAVASVSAILTSSVNAGIELGGIQGLPDKLLESAGKNTTKKLAREWVSSMLDEGKEEVVQGIVSNVTAKMLYNHDAPIYSTTDEDAIINPLKLGKEFALGALAGGVLSGGQIAAVEAINRESTSRIGGYMQEFKDDVIATGLESPKDTESYKIAQKLNEKKGKVSNYDLGKLHLANIDQLETEESDVEDVETTSEETTTVESASAPVAVGDLFIDRKNNFNAIRVVGRSDESTTVEVTTPAGKKEVKTLPNRTADTLVTDVRYTKVETSAAVAAKNTVDVLQNQSPSDTIKEQDADKSHTVAYTYDNQKIDLAYKVVSVDDLIASHELDGRVNPAYPQELQPRDRSRASSQSQISQMANSLNPARLAESTSVAEGAPIIGSDNAVESGNGRTLAIKLAYEKGLAEEYKNFIISNADKYGIDVSNLPEKPILVRERLTEVDRVEFTRKANESSIGSLSATEQAKVDAEKLTDKVLELFVANDDGEINTPDNKEFISSVIANVFNSEDLNNVVNAEGMLSARGLERITNAIFYKAYGDVSLSARLSESLDNDMKNATKVLRNIAPKVVYVKNGIAADVFYDFDFSEDIASAVRLFEKCRNERLTILQYNAQQSMLDKEKPLVLRMAYIFETKNKSAKQATDFYISLLDGVIRLGNKHQISLGLIEVYETKEACFDAELKRFNDQLILNGEESRIISIPESLSGPDSEPGRNDDIRGRDEIPGNESERGQEDRDAVGVQRDNRSGKETGIVTDDEQLRQKKESVVGKSEVSGNVDDDTKTPDSTEKKTKTAKDTSESAKTTTELISKLTDKCTLTATKRTDGEKKNIWVVSLNEKISRDKFNELRKIIKQYGGNWSNYTKTLELKPIPGFMFYSEPSAEAINAFNDFFKEESLSNESIVDNAVDNTGDNEQVLKTEPESDAIAEKEPKKTVSKGEASKQIADYVAAKLAKGEKLSSMELSQIASKAFGGTMANNAFTIKDAYDAMELGVNQHILSMKEVSAEKMLEILELLPTQTKRTEEMVKFQQFSTPPSIAYLANYTANVNANDIMLEPSAGIGGIAVFAKKDGAKVYVNELDPRRLDVLKNMPFDGFFNENAEQLDNILGGEIEPTVIVMNPPFSSSSERNIQNTKIGAKHIEQALKILAPNGRLVAIVGNGMADGTPAFRNWWKDIKSQYNVRANIGINGKNYNKYGTNFDIQMLVIDKNGPTTTETVTGHVDTLQELQDKLGGIRDERPAIDYSANEQRTHTTTRKKAVTTGKRGSNGNGTVSDTGSLTNKGKSADTTRTSAKSTDQDIQSVDTEHRKPASVKTENTDVVANEDGRVGSRKSDRLVGEENSAGVDNSDSGQSDIQTRRTEPRKRVKKKELPDSIFEQYQPQPLRVKNAQPHPAKVSESAAMSAIEPPVINYKPNIPQDIVDKGVVSDVQLEAISYAGQSHSQTLPNGTTRGFFLGDGTGIGKGRTIAGIMLDNYNQGRKKAVWVTLNSSLVNDAKRDVKALFGDSDLVMQFEGGEKAYKIFDKDEAILVVSYSALSRAFDNKDSNFDKIVKWLGKDFDGLIVFDEAHKMGNSTATKGTRGTKKASQTGIAGIALQETLPKARVVYSSATGATEVENLRYAERLGLWGEGTPFVKGDDFVSKVKAGGLAAMELIARDMKAMGVYLSRNISYDDVQYDKITHKLTAPQRKIYDELARSWQIVLQNINKALESTNQDKDGHARGRALGAFWSSQQRFFNQILTSMQVPSVISDIEKQLADGKSCVIQLVSTNEAAQNQEFERLKSEDLELDEFDLTPKQVLMSLIENSFPVQQFEEYRDDKGNVRSRPVFDSKDNPVINRDAVKQRDELLTKLGSIKVPSSPIDMIINHFGTDLVAENTGRARRVIQKNGKTIEEKIGTKKDADVDAFQNGNKRIIIFSKAGGTGKSYHADRSAKNQQQRVHYLLEAGWQADNAVQGFGRSHRSNQASAPIFKLVTTDLKGQMRFISTIAKRLDQLGAMTKGQRQAGGQGMFSASDNLENSFAADVLAVFYKDLISNRVDGIDDGLAILDKLGLTSKILDEYNRLIPTAPELREVNKFLNRILSLECSEQNTVFEGYSQRLQDATERAMQAGTLDKGLENYKADRITLNEVQDIREDEASGAKTKYYNLTAEHKIKPVTFDKIPTESKSFVGFYRNKNTGAVRGVMQTSSSTDQYGNVTSNYKLVGQMKNEYIAQHRLYGNWVEIKADEAEKLWSEELSKLPEYRTENLHLISGVVLPVWDKLPTENVRIYRVLTSDGEMLIGRVVSEDMIDETLRRLGSSRTKEKIATKDLIVGIKNGDKVHLDNGWTIFQSRVSNERRIEIKGPSYEHHDMLIDKGVFAERISYNTRYFIPSETNTEKIIDDILKLSPVMRVENSETVHYSKQSIASDSDTENRWTTKRVDGGKDSKGGNVNIADIVNTIREKFDIPIATGKVTSREASAQYNEKAESIRVRIANNLPDISHELGHHLDKKYGFSNFESIEELLKVVPQNFLDQYKESEWNTEAVAWFLEKYLQSIDTANRLCPDFCADFESSLSKDDLKAVKQIANSINEYMSYNFSERVRASIVSGNAKEKTTLKEKAKKTHANWVDGFLPIKDVVDYVAEKTGVSLSGTKNAYTLATNSLNARAIANFNTVHGFRDLNGNIVEGVKSYIECIANVDRKDLKTLDEYLVLKHSLEWITPKNSDATTKRVFADDTLEDVESIERRIAEIETEHPETKEAAENLYEYQRNILKYIVIPAGGMTESTYNSLNEKYSNYVPFYRAIGKDGSKTKGTFANQKSPLKRAKGSGELIISPLESIIKNTDKMVKFALRNQTMQTLANYADTVDGFGKFMERVPPDMLPRIIDISKQKEKFADALQQAVSTSDDYFAVSDLLDNIFGDAVTDFTPIANSNKKIVTVMHNGEFAYYQIHDEDLYSAIAEFTPTQLKGIWALSDKLMQPMKLLITQNNPIFGATNALRDFGTAYKHSSINNPIVFTAKYISALKEVITKGDIYKQWQAMGGGHNSELSANLDQLKRTLRRVAQKDMGKARRFASSIFLHPISSAASINDYIESVPRVMEFIRTLEAGGDLQEAIYNADDITTNFKRSGRGIGAKQVNSAIMFNNAALQGLDKTYRTLTNKNKDERTKTLLKWLLSALMVAAIESFWNKENDEEGYKNLSSYKKNNYYNFSVGDGMFISIPKARETALLDSLTERTIEYVFGNDEAFYGFGGYVADQLLPPMLPNTLNPVDAAHDVLGSTVLGGIADIGWNKNYTDIPIEGKYETFLPSNERYNEKTTKIAYELGQTKLARMLDMSPKKIDHLISSYTGILGQVNKALFPLNESRKDTSIGLRNKFISDSNYSTDILNQAYDNTDKAKLQWQYDNNINNAIEYEQNAVITSYISGMNKAIKALPEDEQREGIKYLLKALNNWDYDTTTQQSNMISRLDGESISNDYIFEELPSSEFSWTVDKQKYVYQMTPQEYNKYISDYLKVIENARKQYGGNSLKSYAKAKEAAKDYMSDYKKNMKNKYLKKATKVAK